MAIANTMRVISFTGRPIDVLQTVFMVLLEKSKLVYLLFFGNKYTQRYDSGGIHFLTKHQFAFLRREKQIGFGQDVSIQL